MVLVSRQAIQRQPEETHWLPGPKEMMSVFHRAQVIFLNVSKPAMKWQQQGKQLVLPFHLHGRQRPYVGPADRVSSGLFGSLAQCLACHYNIVSADHCSENARHPHFLGQQLLFHSMWPQWS